MGMQDVARALSPRASLAMALRIGVPKTKRGVLGTIAAAVLVVAVGGSAFVYFVLFPTSAPPPFRLSAAEQGVALSSGSSLVGKWTIASGSQAGYRVREKLAFLPALDDAVGRTAKVTGAATFTDSGGNVTVTAASFVINVYSLKSDEYLRDEHIHTIGIQSATYPNASFKLTRPLGLARSALSGGVVDVKVAGDVTMHGTTKLLTIPVEMTLSSSKIQAVGSYTFPWSLFNMQAPSVGGFVNVENKATMEFKLELTRA
jgi:polyisoprenoid-binding protein YceI